ncbi:CU044_2847 family protein [Pantanalinema rosaneae CENA516]|uniref:CU044_2847 family protein n=1 Tax=Pantanalinema rosaneae TaxID=1620701 RepID=UPI003D6F3377
MKTKLAPLFIDKDTVVYIEITEEVEATGEVTILSTPEVDEEEEAANEKGLREDFQKHIQDLQSTIFAYTNYSLAAFKKVAMANVDKVTLEFGIEIGGETGIPYVTKGTAKSNLKIQVECSFTDNENNQG